MLLWPYVVTVEGPHLLDKLKYKGADSNIRAHEHTRLISKFISSVGLRWGKSQGRAKERASISQAISVKSFTSELPRNRPAVFEVFFN